MASNNSPSSSTTSSSSGSSSLSSAKKKSSIFSKFGHKRQNGHQRAKSDDESSGRDARGYKSMTGRSTSGSGNGSDSVENSGPGSISSSGASDSSLSSVKSSLTLSGLYGAGSACMPASALQYTTVVNVPVSLGQKGYLALFPCFSVCQLGKSPPAALSSPSPLSQRQKYCGFSSSHVDLFTSLAKEQSKAGGSLGKQFYQAVEMLDKLRQKQDYRIYGQAIATYPRLCHNEGRDGPEHMVADGWFVHSYCDRMLFGIADGIGHGENSRNAALYALLGLLVHAASCYSAAESPSEDPHSTSPRGKQPEKSSMKNVRQAIKCVVESFLTSQEIVSANTPEMTTLTGGMILRMVQDGEKEDADSSSKHRSQSTGNPMDMPGYARWKWAFAGASLGDCKLYRWSKETQMIMEITSEDASKVSVRDAGGHLGQECVLSNLTAYFCPIDEGDMIFCLSDGVHDNLDPETLRISPRALGLDQDSWRCVKGLEGVLARQRFRETRLSQILGLYQAHPRERLSPAQATERILSYVHACTSELRSAEERGALLQRDWEKMDSDERLR